MVRLNREKLISICISLFDFRRNDILPEARPCLKQEDNVLKRRVLSGNDSN